MQSRVGALALAALVACHSRAAPPSPPLANQGSGAPTFEVKLSRTSCFGTCPVYSVTIHPDGSVDWSGSEFVAARGARHGHIAADGFDRLARAIEKVRFFELDAHGLVPRPTSCARRGQTTECDFADSIICSDTSSATVTITRAGKTHTTTNDHCQQTPLELLEEEIDDVTHTKQWIVKP